MPAKTNANDVPDAIDIEELTRNLEGAKAECSYDYRLARCPCHRHASLFLMEALAPRLAARVVADAAKRREAREALEAALGEVVSVRALVALAILGAFNVGMIAGVLLVVYA